MGLEWSFLIHVTQETGFGDTMPGMIRDFYDVCPDCWSVMIKHRVFKLPRYKCEKCGSEFPNKKRISHDDRILFSDLLRIFRDNKSASVKNMTDIDFRKFTVKAIKLGESHAGNNNHG